MSDGIEPKGFHHVALRVNDVEGVARFYVQVLGLQVLERHLDEQGALRSVWLGVGGEGSFLAVEHAPPGTTPSRAGFAMVALRIDPAARPRVLQALEAAGVAVERQTQWTTYVRDPEGTLVGLSHHPFDAPGV